MLEFTVVLMPIDKKRDFFSLKLSHINAHLMH